MHDYEHSQHLQLIKTFHFDLCEANRSACVVYRNMLNKMFLFNVETSLHETKRSCFDVETLRRLLFISNVSDKTKRFHLISGQNKMFLFLYRTNWDETETLLFNKETSETKQNVFISGEKHPKNFYFYNRLQFWNTEALVLIWLTLLYTKADLLVHLDFPRYLWKPDRATHLIEARNANVAIVKHTSILISQRVLGSD